MPLTWEVNGVRAVGLLIDPLPSALQRRYSIVQRLPCELHHSFESHHNFSPGAERSRTGLTYNTRALRLS